MKTKILLIADTIENKLNTASKELVSIATRLSINSDVEIVMAVSGQNVKSVADEVAEEFGFDVIAIESEHLFYPNPQLLADALNGTIKTNSPHYICLLHSPIGCQIASILAHSNQASCITAVEAVSFRNDEPVFQRSLLNGKLKISMESCTSQTILTLLPGIYSNTAKERTSNIPGTVRTQKVSDQTIPFFPLGLTKPDENDRSLDEADIIISAGRGIGKQENLDIIKSTKTLFANAAVGASRTLCDFGWLPYSRQIGETGKKVSPKLYLACGISGAYQHIAGMKNSQWVIAINTDPNATIFNISDYCIVEDLRTFLPILIRKYEEMFGD